jgi:hypothetical protein
MKKEVTKTFLVGVIPQLLLLPLPWLMYAVSYHISLPLLSGEGCANFNWLIPYSKALITLHVFASCRKSLQKRLT